MRAALYCRVSTEEQARKGLSLPEQSATLRAYASSHGHVVTGEYTDPGVSARKRYTQRSGLMSLLKDAEAGMFDVVLFVKLDRWVRSVRDYYAVQDILDASGVTWQATEEDYETVTASGRLKVNIMLSVAQDEADRTSERIKFVLEGKRARGERTNSKAPFGLRVENSHLQPDPETYGLAMEMFQRFIGCRSVNGTRLWLASNGYPKAYNIIRRALSNRSYIDFVGEGTWELAQSILAYRGQRCARHVDKNRTYLFSGLVRCADCGQRMSASGSERGDKVYRYYRCLRSSISRGEDCPHKVRIREDKIESWLLDNIIELADGHNAAIAAAEKRRRKTPDTTAIRRKMSKLKDLYLNDMIDREEYIRDYTDLKRQLDEIKPAPAAIPVNIGQLKTALDLYHDLSIEGRKEFWSRTIGRIEVDHDNNITAFLCWL